MFTKQDKIHWKLPHSKWKGLWGKIWFKKQLFLCQEIAKKKENNFFLHQISFVCETRFSFSFPSSSRFYQTLFFIEVRFLLLSLRFVTYENNWVIYKNAKPYSEKWKNCSLMKKKSLVGSTPAGVNFIKLLRAAFRYKSVLSAKHLFCPYSLRLYF